jgi:hypothetical protein
VILTGAQLEISTALMAWLSGRPAVMALSLHKCQRDFSLRAQPRYPVNPVADLPDALLQNHTADNQRTTGGGVSSVYMMSIWVRWRQTAGNNAQTDVMTPAQVIETELLSSANPYSIEICGAQGQTPARVAYPDEMPHPLADEPRLRVSFAEILVQVTYRKG